MSPVTHSMQAACTVIVVGYQGERWLTPCLTSLISASAQKVNLVLVDNGGNGDLKTLPLDQFDCQVVVAPHRMGFAEANNFALQQIRPTTQSVCFLNQDTISQPGWIDAQTACLNEHPDVGAISPLLLTYDGAQFDPAFRDCVREIVGFPETPGPGSEYQDFQECRQVTAAALVIRTEALRRSGPFDPVFGSYYEDYDLCRRVRVAGYRVGVCARGAVWHFSGSTSISGAARKNRVRQLMRNRVLHLARESGSHRWRALCGYAVCRFPHDLARSIAHTPSSQPLSAFLQGHLELFSLLPRLLFERTDQAKWTEFLQSIDWSSVCQVSHRESTTGATA